jgi:phthiocerol/phenolphthiocerol synthesis type-I polyketide synthase C
MEAVTALEFHGQGLSGILAGDPRATTEIHRLDCEPVQVSNKAEIDAAARRVAGALAEREDIGARVLVAMPPGPDYFAAFFGCVFAGLIPVPVPPPRGTKRSARTAKIIESCGATRLIADAGAERAAEGFGLRFDPFEALATGKPHCPVVVAPDDVAYLQFTSGSTATPRGVMISHRAILANLHAIGQRAGLPQHGWIVSWLPLHHDMGLVTALLAFKTNSSLAISSPEYFSKRPWNWLEAMTRYKACFSGAPNFAYDLLSRTPAPTQSAKLELSGWKIAFCGAEPIKANVVRRFTRRFAAVGLREAAISPAYGLAEFTLMATSVASTDLLCVRPNSGDKQASGRSGRKREFCDLGPVLDGHRLLIVDPDRREPLGEGEVGEVWLDGPSKGSGYWGLDKESQDVFEAKAQGVAGGFLKTGDMGFLAGDRLYLVGRRKELLIVRGRNFHPDEVEEIVRSAHPVLNGPVAAFMLADGEGIGILCEARKSSRGPVPGELIRAIQSELGLAFGLSADLIAVVRAGTAPRTTSGKIRRLDCEAFLRSGTLPTMFFWSAAERSSRDTNGSSATPPTGRDRRDIRAWIISYLECRLGLDPATIDDGTPLLALGLDSIASIEFAYALEDWLGVSLDETILWQAPTLGVLSNLLQARQRGPRVEAAATAMPVTERIIQDLEALSEAEVNMLFESRVSPGTT